MSRALSLYLHCAFISAVASSQFEWAAIYDVPENIYSWVAHQVDGSYAEDSMKMALLPADEGSEAALHSLEEEGGHSLEQMCVDVAEGGVLVPAADSCFILRFDSVKNVSRFTVSSLPPPKILMALKKHTPQ